MKGSRCFMLYLFIRIDEEYENMKDRDHEENLNVEEMIILKWILKMESEVVVYINLTQDME
jgi:hypothetical protein